MVSAEKIKEMSPYKNRTVILLYVIRFGGGPFMARIYWQRHTDDLQLIYSGGLKEPSERLIGEI